jgi:hypothetical protein
VRHYQVDRLSSLTWSPQVAGLPSSSTSSIAMWVMKRSGAAPCQSSSSGSKNDAVAGPDDLNRPDLSDLVGELATRSETFRTLWATHNVHVHGSGVNRLHHPLVGELTLTFETMELTANPGLTIAVCTPESGSKSEQTLDLLASWTATPDQPQPAAAPDR